MCKVSRPPDLYYFINRSRIAPYQHLTRVKKRNITRSPEFYPINYRIIIRGGLLLTRTSKLLRFLIPSCCTTNCRPCINLSSATICAKFCKTSPHKLASTTILCCTALAVPIFESHRRQFVQAKWNRTAQFVVACTNWPLSVAVFKLHVQKITTITKMIIIIRNIYNALFP